MLPPPWPPIPTNYPLITPSALAAPVLLSFVVEDFFDPLDFLDGIYTRLLLVFLDSLTSGLGEIVAVTIYLVYSVSSFFTFFLLPLDSL